MSHLYRDLLRLVERMGPQEWVVVMAVLIVVGLFCLRGFGSRSRY